MASRKEELDFAVLTVLRGDAAGWCQPFLLLVALRTLGHPVDEKRLTGSIERLHAQNMVEVDDEQGVRALSLLERIAHEA